MTEPISFKLEGLAALQDQLTALGDVSLGVKALAQAARQAFKPVLESARAMVPVDSGELRAALRLTVVKPKGGAAASVVVVGLRIGGSKGAKGIPPARRWHFIEFGTAHMSAHPFLRNALDQNASGVLEALKTELAKSIQKALKKQGK